MLFLDFTVDEFRERLGRIHKLMKDRGVDGLVLSDPSNLTYVTGNRTYLYGSKSRPFLCVVPQGGEPILILPNLEVGNGRKCSWCKDVRGWGTGLNADAPDVFALVRTVLDEKGLAGGRLAAETGFGQRLGMTLEQWEQLKTCAPGAEWVNVAEIMWAARLRKSQQELAYIRVSCRAADAGFMSAVAAGRAGVTEREVVRAMAMGMMGAGADAPASLIISSGRDRYDMLNPYATDRRLEQGDQVIFDFGCWHRGYRSDITRWFYVGEPTDTQKRFNEAALAIFYDALAAVKPGNTAEDVDRAAEESIIRRGYKENMLHRTGHALGLDVHELPSLGAGDRTVLEPGMVIAVEPGIYDFEIGAWRMEDNVLVTETGYELLTNAPRDIIVR